MFLFLFLFIFSDIGIFNTESICDDDSFVTSIKLFITSLIFDKPLYLSFIDFLFNFFGLLKPLIIFLFSNFFFCSIFNIFLPSIISFPILLNTLLLLLL